MEKLLDLYLGDHESKESYLAKKKVFERRMQTRQEEIIKLRMQFGESNPLSPDREAALRLLRKELVGRLDGASYGQKLKTFDMLHVKGVYHDDTKKIVVTGLFGALNLSLSLKEGGDEKVGNKTEKREKGEDGSTSSVTSACCP